MIPVCIAQLYTGSQDSTVRVWSCETGDVRTLWLLWSLLQGLLMLSYLCVMSARGVMMRWKVIALVSWPATPSACC